MFSCILALLGRMFNANEWWLLGFPE